MRERILNETINILKAQGYRGLKMDNLAEAVGVSKKVLYTEFENKEDIVLKVLEQEFECLYKELNLIYGVSELSLSDKLKASLWLVTRRAFECSEQLIHDLRKNPGISELFWKHVANLNSRLLRHYLQDHTKLNEMMLATFFGILINTAAANNHGVNRVSLMLETIQFYTYAWAHMKNGLIQAD